MYRKFQTCRVTRSGADLFADSECLTCYECRTTICQEIDLQQHYTEPAHRVRYTKHPEKDRNSDTVDCGLLLFIGGCQTTLLNMLSYELTF